jgi:hypothetical protein
MPTPTLHIAPIPNATLIGWLIRTASIAQVMATPNGDSSEIVYTIEAMKIRAKKFGK